MEIIKVFYSEDSELKNFELAIDKWYCKPEILGSFAFKLNCLFLTCSKYGCRQFEPHQSKTFPVSYYSLYFYKKNLKYVFPLFGDSLGKPWSISDIKHLYETENMY